MVDVIFFLKLKVVVVLGDVKVVFWEKGKTFIIFSNVHLNEIYHVFLLCKEVSLLELDICLNHFTLENTS